MIYIPHLKPFCMISSIFQAAIIFLHNAKGNNSYVAEQGAKNLHRCSQVIKRDQCLSSTRIAIVLQSIAACFSVNLEEDHLDTSDIQQRRRRKRTNSKTNATTPPAIMHTQEYGSTATNSPVDTAMYNSEKEPMAKHPRPNLVHQLTDIDDNGTTAPFPSYLQHYTSTRPEDMFLTSLSRANPLTASPPSSSTAALGTSTADTSIPYHHQHLPPTQLSLDPLPPQIQHIKEEKQSPYEQQTGIPSWPVEPPLPLQQHPWQGTEQSAVFQQNQEPPFDVTCLSSEVPLYNMPNSVIWEDWDSFLKSNISQ